MKHTLKVVLLTISILGLSLILTLVTSRRAQALVSTLVTITNGAANPVVTNNLGAPPASMVSLSCYLPVFATCTVGYWNLVTASGNLHSYSVPAGYNLVVTDIDIEVISSPEQSNVLSVHSAETGVIFLSDTMITDKNGHGAFREHLVTGIAFAELPSIVVANDSPTSFPSANFSVQGYLVAVPSPAASSTN
jgi:hypothetical protein